MGLKKIFSTSSQKDSNTLKDLNNTNERTSSRTSLSLHSIGNWHKDKDKLKRHSLSTNKRLSNASLPSPPPTIKYSNPSTTQNDPSTTTTTKSVAQEQFETNPFLSSPAITTTSNGNSNKDVNDVVNVLRHSVTSDVSLMTSIAEDTPSKQAPTTIQERDEETNTNPFLSSQNGSNKYETDDDDPTFKYYNNSGSQENDALYKELLAVKNHLDSMDPKRSVEMKTRLDNVHASLDQAFNQSSQLEKKLQAMVETSKQIIQSLTAENKKLKQKQQEFEELTEQQEQKINQHVKENDDLIDKSNQITAQLTELTSVHNNLITLLKDADTDDKSIISDDMNNDQAKLHERLKSLLLLSASSKQLKLELEELKSRHQQEIQEMHNQHQADKHQQEQTFLKNLEQERNNQQELETNFQNQLKQQCIDLENKFEGEKNKQKEQYEQEKIRELQDLENRYEIEKSKQTQEHEAMTQQLEAQHANKLKETMVDYDTRINTLGQQFTTVSDTFDSLNLEMKELQEENTRLKTQVDILKNSTADDVQKVADENVSLLEKLEHLQKESETKIVQLEQDKSNLQKEHGVTLEAVSAELKTVKDNLVKVQSENVELHTKIEATQGQLSEFETSDKALKEKVRQSTESLDEAGKKLSEAESENKKLKEELVGMEQMSKEAAKSVMNENERLENRVREIEENLTKAINENASLKEEIELLNKNTSQKTIINENIQLKSQLKATNNVRQENASLLEVVECLKAQIKELTEQGGTPNTNYHHYDNKNIQEELVKMQTRSQLGLIEYLEGQEDILLAIAKFKKQLETEMKEFDSTDKRGISNSMIASISTSTRMR